jgi:hypothetical protein
VAKHPSTLKVRIPPYRIPRNKWRKDVYKAVKKVLTKKRVSYTSSDKLEVIIRLYLGEKEIIVHDIDNRLKDILDALQGRAGGTKIKPTLKPLIPNDNQIYRVKVQKTIPPKQSLAMGHLTIKKFHKTDK